MDRDTLTISLAFIFALACEIDLLGAEPVQGKVDTAFKDLRGLTGKQYVRSRALFLAMPGTESYLKTRVKDAPEDWLAYALLARFSYPAHVKYFRKMCEAPPIGDPFKDKGDDLGVQSFDSDALRELRMPYCELTDLNLQKEVKVFDRMTQFALDLEWLIKNPDAKSIGTRFWILHQRLVCYLPIDDKQLRDDIIWQDQNPRSHSYMAAAFRTINPKRIRTWLTYARDHEKEPMVRMVMAARLPGQGSEKVLTELSRKDSMLGALSALLFSGRRPEMVRGVGHRFNGPWLAQWTRSATDRQLRAVETVFSERVPNNKSLGIPDMVLGLFLKHHGDALNPVFKKRYLDAQRKTIRFFGATIRDYRPKDPIQDLGHAKDTLKLSILWPLKAEKELNKIATPYPEARKLVDQALANVRIKRSSPYPSGEELQIFYGSPPDKK